MSTRTPADQRGGGPGITAADEGACARAMTSNLEPAGPEPVGPGAVGSEASAAGASDRGAAPVPTRPRAFAAYGRDRLGDARRRLLAEVSARRPARHPHAEDQASRFDALYANEHDPFHVENAEYETRKYDLCMAVLPGHDFGSAYEPGCSIGELSVRLAPRCDALLCSDVSTDALERAQRRLKGHDNVTFERHLLPRDHPAGPFDLVVMGELGYYLEPAALGELIERMAASVAPGGYILAVHGRGVSRDIYQPGDIVHRRLLLESGLHRTASYREEAFRIDVLQRR
jgi:predicted TPR repeat methyltransferase